MNKKLSSILLFAIIVFFTATEAFSQFGNCYTTAYSMKINGKTNIDTCSKEITLSVSYTGNPTYIYWNDGYFGTTRVVRQSGNYQAYAYDSNYCMDTTAIVNVKLNDNYLNVYVSYWGDEVTLCDGKTIDLSCYSVGKFKWNTGDTTSILTVSKAGKYYATMKSKNGCTDTSNTIKIRTVSFNSIKIKALGDTILCLGDSVELEVSGVSGKLGWYPTYENTKKIKVGTSGYHYAYAYDSASGCSGNSNLITVTILTPPVVQLCMVTVDSGTNRNKLVWKKTYDKKIVSYNVYRESNFAGEFDNIGNVLFDSTSQFIDSWSNPKQRPFSYYITAVDSCGNEAIENKYYAHTTLHLTANLGVSGENNLNWSDYLGIYPLNTYTIYRSNKGSSFQAIGSVAATVHSYSDLTPPSGANRYFIGIKGATDCMGSQTMINSNQVAFGILNADQFDISQVNIYPNPVENTLTIQNTPVNGKIEISNAQGRIVLSQKSASSNIQLNTANFAAGIYFLRIENSIPVKIIKQ
jgi:hypothetical protein